MNLVLLRETVLAKFQPELVISPTNLLTSVLLISLPDKSANPTDWYWQSMDTHGFGVSAPLHTEKQN